MKIHDDHTHDHKHDHFQGSIHTSDNKNIYLKIEKRSYHDLCYDRDARRKGPQQLDYTRDHYIRQRTKSTKATTVFITPVTKTVITPLHS